MKNTVIFVLSLVALIWGSVNTVSALKGGITLESAWFLQFAVVCVLPLAISGIGAFVLWGAHGAAINKALHAEPPIDVTVGLSTFTMDSGGVNLRLTVARDKATTANDRDKIVEAVRGVLAVTEVSS